MKRIFELFALWDVKMRDEQLGFVLKAIENVLTFLPRPNRPGSAFAVPAGTPPSSTWSKGPAMLCYHSNRIPFCTAGLIGRRVCPVAPSADS